MLASNAVCQAAHLCGVGKITTKGEGTTTGAGDRRFSIVRLLLVAIDDQQRRAGACQRLSDCFANLPRASDARDENRRVLVCASHGTEYV